jgi:hypothetical protein
MRLIYDYQQLLDKQFNISIKKIILNDVFFILLIFVE